MRADRLHQDEAGTVTGRVSPVPGAAAEGSALRRDGSRRASPSLSRPHGTRCATRAAPPSIAGPGAGKTEFLAQRAAFLLQTGLCRAPRRILAISYKRDSAANLGRRVAARVPEHAGRFVSLTFDAFTKGLVDRFRSALPQAWALNGSYEIEFWTSRNQEDFVTSLAQRESGKLQLDIFGCRERRSWRTSSAAGPCRPTRRARRRGSRLRGPGLVA